MYTAFLHINILSLSLAPHKRDKGTLANSVDPDQTPQNVASDQGLYYLH